MTFFFQDAEIFTRRSDYVEISAHLFFWKGVYRKPKGSLIVIPDVKIANLSISCYYYKVTIHKILLPFLSNL